MGTKTRRASKTQAAKAMSQAEASAASKKPVFTAAAKPAVSLSASNSFKGEPPAGSDTKGAAGDTGSARNRLAGAACGGLSQKSTLMLMRAAAAVRRKLTKSRKQLSLRTVMQEGGSAVQAALEATRAAAAATEDTSPEMVAWSKALEENPELGSRLGTVQVA